jgi:hypothetical protein
MGIERIEEADAPVAGRDLAADQGDGVGDRAVAAETRDRESYRAEYPATVEAEYRSPSESWDTAVLELRRAWDAHEAKWPSTEDIGHVHRPVDPGTWRGDGDRYLDPEANAEVERGCGRIREVGENVITPAMRAIEAEDPIAT